MLDGTLHVCTDHQHVKPGKGGAFIKAKLKNLKKNAIIEKTFRSDEKVDDQYVERRAAQYLYDSGDNIVVMDNENYEQMEVPKDVVGNAIQFMKESMEIEVDIHDGLVINVEPPMFVELEVTFTEPGLKGDTVSGATKPAEVETGYKLQVPLFVDNGDILKIDSRTGEYITRV